MTAGTDAGGAALPPFPTTEEVLDAITEGVRGGMEWPLFDVVRADIREAVEEAVKEAFTHIHRGNLIKPLGDKFAIYEPQHGNKYVPWFLTAVADTATEMFETSDRLTDARLAEMDEERAERDPS